VVSDNLGNVVGVGSIAVPARILVPALEAPEALAALAVLEATKANPSTVGPERCPACDAPWEPGFLVCWQCEREVEG
jgi:hypothetical protein